MTDIAKILRERPVRYASETQDEMQIRRQRERERGAAEIERLRAALQDIIADSFSVYAIQVARAALGGKDE